ncbi:hypothetical protein AB0H12_23050 [Actinosynnema sp. NPDC023794]
MVLSPAWLILPALTVALGLLFPITSFYAFPLAVGGGILLSLYASRLRQFAKVGAKYFLVSDGWTRDRGTVVVLADNDDIRVELGHGEQAHPPGCPRATGPGR